MGDKLFMSDAPRSRGFKEEEYLAPFADHLALLGKDIPADETVEVYRTQHVIPVDEFGQTPNALRARKGTGRRISRKYSPDEVAALTPVERTKAVGKFGLSCNSSEEAAEASFMEGYKKLLDNGASEDELNEYVARRGEHICKFIITSDVGLLTEFRHNHANLYLYEGVDLESCRDKSYIPRKIDFQKYEEC